MSGVAVRNSHQDFLARTPKPETLNPKPSRVTREYVNRLHRDYIGVIFHES